MKIILKKILLHILRLPIYMVDIYEFCVNTILKGEEWPLAEKETCFISIYKWRKDFNIIGKIFLWFTLSLIATIAVAIAFTASLIVICAGWVVGWCAWSAGEILWWILKNLFLKNKKENYSDAKT